jgi:hypothetical protein
MTQDTTRAALRTTHKAFAEWFLQQHPKDFADPEIFAWEAWKAALAQPQQAAPTQALSLALEVLRENNRWHIDYDEHGGYDDSELQSRNLAALHALEQALAAPVGQAAAPSLPTDCHDRGACAFHDECLYKCSRSAPAAEAVQPQAVLDELRRHLLAGATISAGSATTVLEPQPDGSVLGNLVIDYKPAQAEAVQPAQAVRNFDLAILERASEMLTAYAELILRDGATHVEEHHYVPDVRWVAEELRGWAANNLRGE